MLLHEVNCLIPNGHPVTLEAPSEEELFRFMADVDEDGLGHPRCCDREKKREKGNGFRVLKTVSG